jgi:hypothetical protein
MSKVSQSAMSSTPFMDPTFVAQLLKSVEMDYNDPLIQAAFASSNKKTEMKGEEDEKEDPSNKKPKKEDKA